MIIEKNNHNAKYFDDIEQGEVFEYEGELYLKTTEQIINYEIECNCVCLKDGEMCVRFDNDVVYEVKCRLVID